MPKYSFIVPVYNCGKYLVPCVESLLAQTQQDFEILLIDDGTPDNGGAVCDDYAERYECIRAFHKENGGAASARNYGIDRAAGEYLIFIDGDDTIEPDTLARIESAMLDRPADLLIFGMSFDYYKKQNVPERTEKLSVRHHGLYPKEFYLSHFRALFDDNALSSACNKVFSTRILRENGLRSREDMTLYEDLEFVLRYFAHVESFFCMSQALYHYRIDAANFGHKRAHRLENVQMNLDLLEQTMLHQEPVPSGAADLMANLYMQLLIRHLLVTKYRKNELEPVYRYCEASGLGRTLEMGARLGSQETQLWELIRSRNAGGLLSRLNRKRAKIALRKTIKQAMRWIGLRR